jgi:hypothetical protein
MAVFGERVPETTTKYNMLWFPIDTHHGQRYFFICGCKRTVKRNGAKRAIPEFRRSFERLAGGIRGDECGLADNSRAEVTRRMPEAPAGRSRDLRDAAFF